MINKVVDENKHSNIQLAHKRLALQFKWRRKMKLQKLPVAAFIIVLCLTTTGCNIEEELKNVLNSIPFLGEFL